MTGFRGLNSHVISIGYRGLTPIVGVPRSILAEFQSVTMVRPRLSGLVLGVSIVELGTRVTAPLGGPAAGSDRHWRAQDIDPASGLLALERGQIQSLANTGVLHYRSRFSDHDDPAPGRHLVRTWHREPGRRSYDG